MNFFENELRKIMEKSSILTDQRYVGRVCYGRINEDVCARIEFATLGVSDHYAGMKTSIINRKDGVVDSLLLRFSDIFGKRKVSNPNFKDGIIPYIWTNAGESEWYVFKPGEADYKKLTGEIDNYLSVFQEMEMNCQDGMTQQMNP